MTVEEILTRIRSNLNLKIILAFGLTVGVHGTYVLLQRFPVFSVTIVQPTWLDRQVPFIPSAVGLYESIWLLMPIGPWLMVTKSELYKYAKGMLLIAVPSFLVFFFHPTACSRSGITSDNFWYGILIRVDGELNAWPSLHAAFAVFHAGCCHVVFPRKQWLVRTLIWGWAIAILISTLLTRQHVFYDALSGAILGGTAYVFVWWKQRAPSVRANKAIMAKL